MANRIHLMLTAAAVGMSLMMAAPAQAQSGHKLLGGPNGVVKSSTGDMLEGQIVQLISKKTHIRTTVYTDANGRYEFPKLEPGAYTLRIALPREYQPFVKETVEIKGADKLEDISLKRVSPLELLPPSREIAAQMTGAEWLLSLSGTGEEKRLMTLNCNWCHSYQQIFRNRYDEDGWRKIVNRMTHGAGSPLILMRPNGRFNDADEARLVKWLATVRAPNAEDPFFVTLPRPQGKATRVIITEYELPRVETATHDVAGDAQGRIWYSTHRSSYIGRLDPKTGVVREYRIPPVAPGALPGTHWIHVDKDGMVWGSENWAHNIYRLNPETEEIVRVPWKVVEPINAPMGGNYALDPNGFIWKTRNNEVSKVEGLTGKQVAAFKTKKFPSTYGSALSRDGRYFGGGAWPRDGVVVFDSQTNEMYEPSTSPGSGPARGAFDFEGNYWAGGRGGQLVKFDIKTKRVHEYKSPTPYASFYSAIADKNGEVWAGEMHAGRYSRFDPKTGVWTQYMLPEPYGIDRKSWVDNSTDPVSVWYVDQEGYIARLQPLD